MVNCNYTCGEYILENGIDLPEDEKWIKGFEGSYTISKTGYVISYKNKEPLKLKGGVSNHKNRTVPSGYRIVSLSIKGERKAKTYKCHRLLAEYFIPNPENKPCVNHIDGDKLNNHIDNLEWVTYSENTIHAIETGLITHTPKDYINLIDDFINNGELNGYGLSYLKSLISDEDFERNGLPSKLGDMNYKYNGRSIKDLWYENCKVYRMSEEGYKASEISKVTGVDIATVYKIKANERQSLGYEIYKNSLTDEEKADILDVRKINERKQLYNLKEVGPCENCGEIMEEQRSLKRFCSNACYQKFNKKLAD